MEIVTFDEFARNQDCERIWLHERYLFSNGAESDGNRMHNDPPDDEFDKLYLQQEFVSYKLEKETSAFNEFKNDCLNRASMAQRYANLPGPTDDATEQLLAGRVRIFKLRKELKAIEERLTESPEYKQAEKRRAVATAQRSDQTEMLQKISDVTI